MLALYNQWTNARLYAAAGQIAPEALAEERGAFFRSLLRTLNHLLATDRGWMARLEGESPRMRLDEVLHHDFADLRAARQDQDWKLVDYVHGLSEERLTARLDYATSSGAPQSQPLHHVLAHLFNRHPSSRAGSPPCGASAWARHDAGPRPARLPALRWGRRGDPGKKEQGSRSVPQRTLTGRSA